MKILGIETSCDETAAAVVEDGRKILVSAVASSARLQKKFGGIIPEVAARKQAELMPLVLGEVINKIGWKEIGMVAVTTGPGLIGSLLVGIETAKTLAYLNDLPIIGVNHLTGHLYAAWIRDNGRRPEPEFPLVGLLVSGGHTELVEMKSHRKIRVLGQTRDDAAGEALDKIARMLGFAYPGGPAIETAAEKFERKSKNDPGEVNQLDCLPRLPRPMLNSGDYDFSFSGLKTAVYNLLNSKKNKKYLKLIEAELITGWLADETEAAICEVLTAKLFRAAAEFKPKGIILAGGVAANKRLRRMVEVKAKTLEIRCFIPAISLCSDNAAYIAAAASFQEKPSDLLEIKAQPNLQIGK